MSPKPAKTKPSSSIKPFHQYSHQRSAFFKKHPRARVLIGVLLVVFAYYIGQLYKNFKYNQAVGEYLLNEGIVYQPVR